MHANDLVGEQKGVRPHHPWFMATLLLSLALVPVVASASTKYIKENVDNFIARTETSYGQMVDIAALLHDYDANMITAVIIVESEGNAVAVSNKGAKGLMQLMPGTAAAMGAKDPKDPFQNILAGTKYLKQLENRYGFEPMEALVAYNMGPSRAKRWLSQYDSGEYGYVKKVMYVYEVLEQKDLEKKRIALTVQKKIDDSVATQNVLRPLMTRPRNISLAELPLTLPGSRKGDLVSDN